MLRLQFQLLFPGKRKKDIPGKDSFQTHEHLNARLDIIHSGCRCAAETAAVRWSRLNTGTYTKFET